MAITITPHISESDEALLDTDFPDEDSWEEAFQEEERQEQRQYRRQKHKSNRADAGSEHIVLPEIIVMTRYPYYESLLS